MKNFPFFTLRHSLLLLRISVAIIFLAHAGYRLLHDGSLKEFARYLNQKGFIGGAVIVGLITFFEIAGGIAMLFGFFVKWLAAMFIMLLIGGIIIIHLQFGWFVGEHGTGGCEYSFVLIVALLTTAAAEHEKHSLTTG